MGEGGGGTYLFLGGFVCSGGNSLTFMTGVIMYIFGSERTC